MPPRCARGQQSFHLLAKRWGGRGEKRLPVAFPSLHEPGILSGQTGKAVILIVSMRQAQPPFDLGHGVAPHLFIHGSGQTAVTNRKKKLSTLLWHRVSFY